jgi:hypothetical protein
MQAAQPFGSIPSTQGVHEHGGIEQNRQRFTIRSARRGWTANRHELGRRDAAP